jgi:uncharacterized tellurite resistance protein B-like protein
MASPRYIFAMFDVLKSMLTGHGALTGGKASFDAEDYRLAEAALMFHVIAADGAVKAEERSRMREVLIDGYDLSSNEVDELFEAAKQADSEAVDLYRFTGLLKGRYNREERIALIERLWEMVFADGKLHEFEDNVVWRIAQLMEVETPDRIAMKQRVRKRLGLGDDPGSA